MNILALERELPGTLPDGFKRFAEGERRKACELHQAGRIRELYFRANQSTAVLMLECDSTEEAKNILGELPYVREGLIAFEITPFESLPCFTRLFKEIT